MRKLLTSSILILMFSLFSGAVLAGDKGVCDENEYGGKKALQKAGVYGLCVAYQNADDADKPAIADKFFERFGDVVPGLIPEQDFFCPCFESLDFEKLCSYGEPDDYLIYEGEVDEQVFVAGLVFFYPENGDFIGFDTYEANCSFGHMDAQFNVLDEVYRSVQDGNPLIQDGDVTEISDCRTEIEVIGTITPETCAALGY